MHNRLVLLSGALAVVGVAAMPAVGAAPKPKAFKASYAVKLDPDPSSYHGQWPSAFGTGCNNLNADSIHRRKLTIPGKGKLTVTLNSPDSTPAALKSKDVSLDWDLHILKDTGEKAPNTGLAAEEELSSSQGSTTSEQTVTTFTKATKIIIEVCNNIGTPDQPGTVTYSFKP